MLTSQGEADILSRLNLGSSTAILENSTGNPLEELLKNLMQGVIDELVKSMAKYDVSASGFLQQSMKPTNVIIEGGAITAGIQVDEKAYYWKFINGGVNGTELNHGAPDWSGYVAPQTDYKQSVLKWIGDRGITTDGDYDDLAFAIMKNIKKYGKKPRPFFDDVIKDPKLIELLKRPIEKLIGRAIAVKIAEPWQ